MSCIAFTDDKPNVYWKYLLITSSERCTCEPKKELGFIFVSGNNFHYETVLNIKWY